MLWIKQLFKFGIIGLINTILTYLIYTLLWHITNPTIAMAIGYGITSVIGLTINKQWVFKSNNNLSKIAVKYYTTYLLTWLLSVTITYLISTQSTINEQIIPLIALIITIPTNFCLSKYWVFSNHQNKEEYE
ncbi:GtrA family protein [Apilactobacillus micheneri]|uniref:GtrA family protein n=2 Tax=Apilactobacillus micheneri TaxID=1899430 RepID=A0ABY2YWQ0_9LACO|nr:GtrA family protein [Apilactobacillus micheneri]TPR26098.1 GtrA family protein [Apilactobacillus micheneri]TPR28288.1 GtrA family protein [Apilactobacillus micheneri]TPR29779.1 GtrA family protein [Apilactobacillus micheneri]TPR30565.1 GtrA family protein [Apilactobacillus micheneri]